MHGIGVGSPEKLAAAQQKNSTVQEKQTGMTKSRRGKD